MKRLIKTAVVLVVLLVAAFGGEVAYKHLRGKDSVADHLPPVSSWRSIRVGAFAAKLPHEPKSGSATSAGVTTTVFSLGADLDSFVITVSQSPAPATATASVDSVVRSTAAGSKLTVGNTAQATIGGKPGETYRLVGTAGGQPVSAFGAAVTSGDLTVILQYDVGGHPTTAPAFLKKVLDTVAFSG